MRRIKTWPLPAKRVMLADRDYRLMRAAVRALEEIANKDSAEHARDPFWAKVVARMALNAFNAPEKRK